MRGFMNEVQDPTPCSVTVGVSQFERCALWVQVLYYPFYGIRAASASAEDYNREYVEEDPQFPKQKPTQSADMGEPVILRCRPYTIPLTDLILPHNISPVEYFRLWPSLPALAECTGTYTYEGTGFKASAPQHYGSSPFLSGLASLPSKPFHPVSSHFLRTVAGFQLCYAGKTWHGGFLGMMIMGWSEVSRNVDLGDESTTMMCRFVMRGSDPSITTQIASDPQAWLHDLTDGRVQYVPEDDLRAATLQRLLPPARPHSNNLPKSNPGQEERENTGGAPDGAATTAEEAEHRALQAAVIQEWHMLYKDGVVGVK